MTARGERNNNPTNLDYHENITWQGQTGIEPQPLDGSRPRFAIFSDVKWGLRAAARQLLTNQNVHGAHTVRAQINLWAPPSENVTSAYVTAVAAGVGVGPDDEINVDDPDTMRKMLRAIIMHENASDPYPDSVISDAMNLAGVSGAKPAPLVTQHTFQTQVAGGVAVAGAAVGQVSQYAPTVKGWADQLGTYAGAPIVQHVVTVLLTVAGGLAILGIASQVLKQKAA